MSSPTRERLILQIISVGMLRRDVATDIADAILQDITRLQIIETAARRVAETLNGGFVRCERCGEQESTTDVDFASDLYAALGISTETLP